MKITNTTLIALSLVAATGCMSNRRQEDRAQGGSNPSESASTVAQASAPPQADHPLNDVERADKLIGEEVLTSDHLKTGKIDDFVVDQDSGQLLYAVVGIGGVLGVGETRVAVPPAVFTQAKKGEVQLNIDKRKLTQAPQVTRDIDKSLKADFLNNVYGYYGQTPSWQRTGSAPGASLPAARKVSDLDGMKVVNSAHQDIGKVETIALDVPKGRELYVVISPSTSLNLGNNYYALPPKAVKFSPDDKTLVAEINRDKLANAPHFTKDDWSELSDTAWAHKVYQYYGQPAFQNPEIQPTGRSYQTTPAYRKP
jgi:sporulation protein YlmC with PRC-barrel domain